MEPATSPGAFESPKTFVAADPTVLSRDLPCDGATVFRIGPGGTAQSSGCTRTGNMPTASARSRCSGRNARTGWKKLRSRAGPRRNTCRLLPPDPAPLLQGDWRSAVFQPADPVHHPADIGGFGGMLGAIVEGADKTDPYRGHRVPAGLM